MSAFNWTPYDSAGDVERFTEGDCHILARAIHRATGWTFCTFDWKGLPDEHAFVRRPDGMLVDVEGVFTEPDYLAKWSHDRIMEWNDFDAFTAKHPTWAGHWCSYGLYSYLRAWQLASKIEKCSA